MDRVPWTLEKTTNVGWKLGASWNVSVSVGRRRFFTVVAARNRLSPGLRAQRSTRKRVIVTLQTLWNLKDKRQMASLRLLNLIY